MTEKAAILIAGRSRNRLESLEASLQSQPGIEVRLRRLVNGYADPLHGVTPLPDVFVLDLDDDWQLSLEALGSRPGFERPPMITVAAEGSPEALRMAMQVGSRDFFTHPVPTEEFFASIRRILEERASQDGVARGMVTAVVNAKGGSGASLLAANLAHILVARLARRVALLDLDLQFGSLPLYLDLPPADGLIAALENPERLDGVALQGHMIKHASGVHLLAAMSEQAAKPWAIPESALAHLLDQAVSVYQHVVVDLPRQLDPLTSLVLERADQVLVVMQQGITHLRDAKRMLGILKDHLGVPQDHIQVIVNRFDSRNPVRPDDICEALGVDAVTPVPNDYRCVAEAGNLGIPLFDHQRRAGVTKAIIGMAEQLGGQPQKQKGFLRNVVSHLVGA
jgi:pilus assembly protein CpaE